MSECFECAMPLTNSDKCTICGAPVRKPGDRDDRIAELEADLSDTLRAVLHHFGPDGAQRVTETVLELKRKR